MNGKLNSHVSRCDCLLNGLSHEVYMAMLTTIVIMASSVVRIPVFDVPVTPQTLIIALMCMFLPRRYVIGGLLLYTIIWVPLPTTIGYRLGFFLLPFLLSKNTASDAEFIVGKKIFLSLIAVLLSGTVALSAYVGWRTAVITGFLFFIPIEALKTLIVLLITNRLKGSKSTGI